MKKRTLAIGTIAVAALLAGGWALAQSVGPQGGFGPAFMHGSGHGGMGPGTMKGMRGHGHDQGHDRAGAGMMKGMGGHGPGNGKKPGMLEPEADPELSPAGE